MKVVDHFKKKLLFETLGCKSVYRECMHAHTSWCQTFLNVRWLCFSFFFLSVVQSLVKFNDSLPQCQCILSEYHKRYNCLLHFLLKSLRLDILIYKMTMISNRHLFPKLLFPSMFYVVLQKLALWSSRLLESEVQDI